MREYARMGRRMRRGRRGDRGMHYGYGRDYRGGDYEYDSARNDEDFDDSTEEDLKDLVIIDEDELELEE